MSRRIDEPDLYRESRTYCTPLSKRELWKKWEEVRQRLEDTHAHASARIFLEHGDIVVNLKYVPEAVRNTTRYPPDEMRWGIVRCFSFDLPSYGRDDCEIHVYEHRYPYRERYWSLIESIMADLGAIQESEDW